MVKKIVYKNIVKKVLITDRNDSIDKHWIGGYFYEAKVGMKYRAILPYIMENYSGGVVIDVGANKGNHTLFFSEIYEEVISIEPNKKNYGVLKKNVQINNLRNVKTFNIAASDKKGTVSLKNNQKNNSGAWEVIEGGDIPCDKLDNIILGKVDCIKIDVEGHEESVLKGAARIIEQYHPTIFIEGESEWLIKNGYRKIDIEFNATPTFIYVYEKYEALEKEGYALGNFINITPTIKWLYDKSGEKVDVQFTTEYTKQCFIDCPFINIVEEVKNPIVHSGMVKLKPNTPDYKAIFESVTKIKYDGTHSYVDEPKSLRVDEYVVLLNGIGGKDGGHWVGKKEVDEETHKHLRDVCGYPIIFTGSERDLEKNTPWAKTLFNEVAVGDIRHSLALIKGAKYVVANDTGLAHAAAAMRKNLLILWKDTPFEKNLNPNGNTVYSRKDNWKDDISLFFA